MDVPKNYPTMSEEVALKLGLRSGVDCPDKDCIYGPHNHHLTLDLTTVEGTDKLMTALQGHYFYMAPAVNKGWQVIIDDDDHTESYGNNWREALLEAAWILLIGK